MGADSGSKRVRRNEVAKKTKKCSYCPPHGGENRGRRPRSDRHKNKRRPIEPIAAYARIGYECVRCNVIFMSETGPEPFCKNCRKVLEAKPTDC